MTYDSRRLAMLISQAAHHLHAVVGNVATALLDVSQAPRMLFSNSALTQINGGQMVAIARDYATLGCEQPPCLYKHPLEDGLILFLTVLDTQHVFVVVGQPQDEIRVEDFAERLRLLLPAAQAS